MATKTVPAAGTAPTTAEAPWQPDAERVLLALSACQEIASIADLIQLQGEDLGQPALHGLSIRLCELAGVGMASLGDERDTMAAMLDRYRGPAAAMRRSSAELDA